jgi:MerR family transcriptional regulator, repressor of the yfmOP operon
MPKHQPSIAARDDEATLQIGEVAERTGVTQRTLRFYEEKGLLQPPSRMDGGFRLYSEDDVRRVEQIKRLQKLLGFTLAEIKEMLEAEEVREEIREERRQQPDVGIDVKRAQVLTLVEVTERQYELIRQKVEALNAMKGELEERLSHYARRLEEIDKSLKDLPAGTPTSV